jgi:hypothetical protein
MKEIHNMENKECEKRFVRHKGNGNESLNIGNAEYSFELKSKTCIVTN